MKGEEAWVVGGVVLVMGGRRFISGEEVRFSVGATVSSSSSNHASSSSSSCRGSRRKRPAS